MAFIDTIHPNEAAGELAALYKRVSNPDGSIDNVMRIHSLNPESMRTHFEMYVAAMHKDSPLSRAEREIVAVVVSRLNGCEYCVQHHSQGLKRLLPDERAYVVDHLATGKRTHLNGREEAIVNYARKLTTNPHDMRESDVQALRDAGLEDRAVLDLAQCIGYFCYANRIVKGLGVTLESDEDVQPGQWPTELSEKK